MHDAPVPPAPLSMPSVARVRAHYLPLCTAAVSHFGTGSLAGRLLLIDGLSAEGDALLIAASIAGAASLTLETQTEAVRHCVRNGIVDFAVTTLDEALRILKNELRKQQPIAVLLEREPAGVLSEMVVRGAQPDMLRWAAAEPAIDTPKARGAQPLPLPLASLPDTERNVCWRAGEGGSVVLRQLDILAGQVLPSGDAERQNWVTRAPRYLPRAMRLERCTTMTEQEWTAFLAAVEERAQQGALAARVAIETGGHVRSFDA